MFGVSNNRGVKMSAEYAVYVFDRIDSEGLDGSRPAWRKHHTTKNASYALARAKILARSEDYQRVEIKRLHCDGTQCYARSPKAWKVFGKKRKSISWLRWFS